MFKLKDFIPLVWYVGGIMAGGGIAIELEANFVAGMGIGMAGALICGFISYRMGWR